MIEHQALRKACPVCQTVTAGEFPAEVTQSVEALGDLFGVSPAEGTLARAQQTAYTELAPVEHAIGNALRQADVAHVDETGIQVAGHPEWVHVMSTAALTF